MMMITNFENSFLIGMNFRHEKALLIKNKKNICFFLIKSREIQD